MYNKIIEYFRENEDVFVETIEELDSYSVKQKGNGKGKRISHSPAQQKERKYL